MFTRSSTKGLLIFRKQTSTSKRKPSSSKTLSHWARLRVTLILHMSLFLLGQSRECQRMNKSTEAQLSMEGFSQLTEDTRDTGQGASTSQSMKKMTSTNNPGSSLGAYTDQWCHLFSMKSVIWDQLLSSRTLN